MYDRLHTRLPSSRQPLSVDGRAHPLPVPAGGNVFQFVEARRVSLEEDAPRLFGSLDDASLRNGVSAHRSRPRTGYERRVD